MKKERKLVLLMAVMVLSITMFSCKNGNQSQQLQSQLDSLSLQDSVHQQDVNSMQDFITIMSDGLDSISAQEGLLKQMGGREGNRIDKVRMREQLVSLSQLIQRQKQRISDLEQQLAQQKKSDKSGYTAKIQKLIDYYKKQLDEKDETIAELKEELNNKNANIASLNENVKKLTASNEELGNTVESQKATIDEQDQTIHTGYVKIATGKELKKLGILKGGFLQKKKVDVSDINTAGFKKIDIRNYDGAELQALNPQVLTQMPASSYEIIKHPKTGSSTLKIKDPALFWSTSKCLIIKLY